jgi:hypothetical protein
MSERPLTGIYELLDAIEATIKSAPDATRKTLAATIAAYADDFPDDYFWAVGPQAPVMLYHIMNAIETAANEEGEAKARVIRLVDRKPEGGA